MTIDTDRPAPWMVSLVSGVIAGVLLAAAWAFDHLVFQLPAVLSFLVAGAVCNAVFVGTLCWLARRGADDRATAVRVLLGWAVVCPVFAALAAWLVRGLTGGEVVMLLGEQAMRLGLSAWSLELSSHFMAQAGVRALVGVASAAWLLVRASVRRPAQGDQVK